MKTIMVSRPSVVDDLVRKMDKTKTVKAATSNQEAAVKSERSLLAAKIRGFFGLAGS